MTAKPAEAMLAGMADEERITVEIDTRQVGAARKLLVAVVGLLALNLAAVGVLIARQPPPPKITAATGLPAWEYKMDFYVEGTTTISLAAAGLEGWELIDIRRARDSHDTWGAEVVFRRPKR